VNGVDTKPAWDGGGIDVDVVDEKRAAEGQYLNDDEGFDALKFLPHSFFEGEFIMGQDAISLLFLLFQGDIRGVILFEGLPSLLVDQLCLLGIHLQFL